jgi:hypothetical protein
MSWSNTLNIDLSSISIENTFLENLEWKIRKSVASTLWCGSIKTKIWDINLTSRLELNLNDDVEFFTYYILEKVVNVIEIDEERIRKYRYGEQDRELNRIILDIKRDAMTTDLCDHYKWAKNIGRTKSSQKSIDKVIEKDLRDDLPELNDDLWNRKERLLKAKRLLNLKWFVSSLDFFIPDFAEKIVWNFSDFWDFTELFHEVTWKELSLNDMEDDLLLLWRKLWFLNIYDNVVEVLSNNSISYKEDLEKINMLDFVKKDFHRGIKWTILIELILW